MSNWTDDEDNKTHTGKSKICLVFILWLGAIFEIFSMTLRLFLSKHLSTGDSSQAWSSDKSSSGSHAVLSQVSVIWMTSSVKLQDKSRW